MSSNGGTILQSTAGSLISNFWVNFPLDPRTQSIVPSSLVNISIITATLSGCTLNATDGRFQCTQLAGNSSNADADTDTADKFNAIVTTCILYPCVRNSLAEVWNGVFTETTVNEVLLRPQGAYLWVP